MPGVGFIRPAGGGGGGATVELTVSDTTPDYGDTITLTATPSNITPDTYIFYAINSSDEISLINQGSSNSYSWTVDVNLGNWTIFVDAVESDSIYACSSDDIEVNEGLFDVDAELYLTALGISKDNTVYYLGTPQEATGIELFLEYSNHFKELKSFGIYSPTWSGYPAIGARLLAMYPLEGNTASMQKWNGSNPLDFDSAFRLQFNGGWLNTETGAKSNASNTYANTFLNLANDLTSGNYAFVLYIRTDIAENSTDIGASQTTGTSSFNEMRSRQLTNTTYAANQAALNFISTASSSDKCWILARVGGDEYIIQNGVTIDTTTSAASTLPNLDVFFGARNRNGVFNNPSSREYSYAAILENITLTDLANMRSAIDNLMTVRNKNV